jgi:hypothetical protein
MEVITIKVLKKVSGPWSWKHRRVQKVRAGTMMYTYFYCQTQLCI